MTNQTNAKPGASAGSPKMQEQTQVPTPPYRARRLSEQLALTFWRDQMGPAEPYIRCWVYLFCIVFCIASWTGLIFGIRALLSMLDGH